MHRLADRLWLLGALVALVGCAAAPSAPRLPEAASGSQAKALQQTRRFMVSAGHPLAADAGVTVLRNGGSAVDAAIAVQLVLTLVEPQASGIGGGAFLLHWDGRRVQAFDGRERAPAAAGEDLFLGTDGQPMPFAQAAVGGRAVGVPGVLRMLDDAHRQHGRLPWAQLFEPVIALAENGFAVGPRMHELLRSESALKLDPRAAAYFYQPDGTPWPVGHVLRNPALASVLRRLAAQGAKAFYQGPLADDLVARVRTHATPGALDAADLAGYRAVEREPICTDWAERWRVCGMPPPSSGHLAVMQILGMLAHAAPAASPLVQGVPGADWLHVYAEASRLAFADRALYVADPDFVAAPAGDWRSLLAPDYLRERAALIGARALAGAPAGTPAPLRSSHAPQLTQPEHGTSQVSIVDAFGNALSMTTSIQTAWGSRILADGGTGLAGGYLLNNELTDFAFAPRDAAGRPVANRVAPGKRPRSSMSPTLVFARRNDRLDMALGSTLGPIIIHSVAKTLLGSYVWGLDVQQAIDLPNFGTVDAPVLLEQGRFPAATVEALQLRGHRVVQTDLPTGAQAVQRVPGGLAGGADPRKEGVARGD